MNPVSLIQDYDVTYFISNIWLLYQSEYTPCQKKFIINIERETIKENYRLYIILFFLIDKNPKRVFDPLYVLPKIIYLSQPKI